MELLWVLLVFLQGTDVKEEIYFKDLNTCLEYSIKINNQNTHQRVAGDKIHAKTYCIPKKAKK